MLSMAIFRQAATFFGISRWVF